MLQKIYDGVIVKSNQYLKDLGIPEIDVSTISQKKNISLGNLPSSTNKQLEEYISVFGGYLVYVKLQLADLTSRKGALDAIFDEALSRKVSELDRKYTSSGAKRVLREVLHGEAMESSEDLKKIKLQKIELEATISKLNGIKDAYDTAYFAVSRVVSLRTTGVISNDI